MNHVSKAVKRLQMFSDQCFIFPLSFGIPSVNMGIRGYSASRLGVAVRPSQVRSVRTFYTTHVTEEGPRVIDVHHV